VLINCQKYTKTFGSSNNFPILYCPLTMYKKDSSPSAQNDT
jgi:hypothetical protein